MSACLERQRVNAVRHIGFEYREHPGNDFIEPSLLSDPLLVFNKMAEKFVWFAIGCKSR